MIIVIDTINVVVVAIILFYFIYIHMELSGTVRFLFSFYFRETQKVYFVVFLF